VASAFASLIAVMAIMVTIFLVCRAIVLWYWRVNEGIAPLKSIYEKLGLLTANGIAVQAPAGRVVPARSTGSRYPRGLGSIV
jgi:hypothetical protein